MTNRKLTTEPVNQHVKDHALALEGWKYKAALANLHEWAQRFNDHFRLNLQTPVIGFDQLRRRTLGTYRHRNAVGLRHEILFHRASIVERPMWDQLATLLHELVHQWQDQFGHPKAQAEAQRQMVSVPVVAPVGEILKGRK